LKEEATKTMYLSRRKRKDEKKRKKEERDTLVVAVLPVGVFAPKVKIGFFGNSSRAALRRAEVKPPKESSMSVTT